MNKFIFLTLQKFLILDLSSKIFLVNKVKRKISETVVSVTLILLAISPVFCLLDKSYSSNAFFYVIRQNSESCINFNVFRLVNRLLLNGFNVYLVTEIKESNVAIKPGDFLVSLNNNDCPFAVSILDTYINLLHRQLNVTVEKVDLGLSLVVTQLKKPKIAVYYGKGTTGNAIEHISVLEKTDFELKLLTLGELEKLDYADFNVVIFPGGGPYKNYIAEDHISKVKRFVLNGGGYIGICGGAAFGAEIGLLNVELMKGELYPQFPEYADFRGPIRLRTTQNNILTLGCADSLKCMYFRGPFFSQVGDGVEIAAFFDTLTDKTEVYFPELAKAHGFHVNIASINRSYNTPAVVFGNYGKGKVVLSSVHPEILNNSQRFFINMIFFALSGEKSWFNPFSIGSKQVSEVELHLQKEIFNMTFIMQEEKKELKGLQSLIDEVLSCTQGINYVNKKLLGVTADYLNLFIEDVNTRIKCIFNNLEKLGITYQYLEVVEEGLNKTVVMSILHKKVLRDISLIKGCIREVFISFKEGLLPNVKLMMESLREVLNITRILDNFSLVIKEGRMPENEKIITLHLYEVNVIEKIKVSMEFFLLNISFKIKKLAIALDILHENIRLNML